jgi:hypothetical protein
MATNQGSLALLSDPVAQNLLHSNVPARLAYVWEDGTPRVVPIWFNWNGTQVVVASPPNAPKVKVLKLHPKVALTIDSNTPPYKVLLIRGTANVELIEGGVPEYALAAEKYYGEEQGKAWLDMAGKLFTHFARIAITPEWVAVMDFEQRFPNAIEDAMAGGS